MPSGRGSTKSSVPNEQETTPQAPGAPAQDPPPRLTDMYTLTSTLFRMIPVSKFTSRICALPARPQAGGYLRKPLQLAPRFDVSLKSATWPEFPLGATILRGVTIAGDRFPS